MAELDQLRDDIATLPATAQRLVIDFVGFLKQRYAPPQPPPPYLPLDLDHEPFVGMWSDRPEMQDSTAWVRRVREEHWRS